MNNGPDNPQTRSARDDELYQDAPLESALRSALRHEDTPAGFTDRLVSRVVAGDHPRPLTPLSSAQPAGKLLRWPVRRVWAGGAVAAAMLLGLVEGEMALKRLREQQRRITEATMQFQTSERVTVRALAQAREQLQRAGVPLTFD